MKKVTKKFLTFITATAIVGGSVFGVVSCSAQNNNNQNNKQPINNATTSSKKTTFSHNKPTKASKETSPIPLSSKPAVKNQMPAKKTTTPTPVVPNPKPKTNLTSALNKSFVWLAGAESIDTPWLYYFGGIGFNPNTMKVTYNLYQDLKLLPHYATGAKNLNNTAPYIQWFKPNQVVCPAYENDHFNLFDLKLLTPNQDVLKTLVVNANTKFSTLYQTLNNWTFQYQDQFEITINELQKIYFVDGFVTTVNAVNGFQPICNSPSDGHVQNVGIWTLKFAITPNGIVKKTNNLISNPNSNYQTIKQLSYSNNYPKQDYLVSQGFNTSTSYQPCFVGTTYEDSFNVGANMQYTPDNKTTAQQMAHFLTLNTQALAYVKNALLQVKKETNLPISNVGYDNLFLKNLTNYVFDTIHYNAARAGYYDASQTINNREGVCFNKALVFAEIASYAGFVCSIVDGSAFSKPNNYVSYQGAHSFDLVYNPQAQSWQFDDPTWDVCNINTFQGHFNRANQLVAVTMWNPNVNFFKVFTQYNVQQNTNPKNAYYLQAGISNQYFFFKQTFNATLMLYVQELFRQANVNKD